VLGRVPQPGAEATYAGIVMTGGASRGRGRGIATIFVERSPELVAADEAFADTGTGAIEKPTASEGRKRKGESRD